MGTKKQLGGVYETTQIFNPVDINFVSTGQLPPYTGQSGHSG
jgi:hypothetical protein